MDSIMPVLAARSQNEDFFKAFPERFHTLNVGVFEAENI
jgi:hypothetical protein